MPAAGNDTTTERRGAAKLKRRPIKAPKGDVSSGGGYGLKPKKPIRLHPGAKLKPAGRTAIAPPSLTAPTGDTKSNADLGRAKRFEHTPAFRSSVRAAYLANDARSELAAEASKHPGLAAAAVIHEHASRIARHLELGHAQAQHDVANADDLAKADEFRKTPEFRKAISDAAYHRVTAKGGTMVAASTAAADALAELQSTGALSRLSPDPLKIAGIAAFQTARATYEDPIGVTHKTVAAVPRMAAGAVAAIPELTIKTAIDTAHGHPLRTLTAAEHSMAEDLKHRYGPLEHGDTAAFRRRIKTEGALPEIVDAASLASGIGAVGGEAAGALARSGALGSRLERVATEARPGLRVAGNKVREQDLSSNLARATVQRGEDKLRRTKYAKKGAKGIHPEGGEVAPIFAARSQRVEASKLSSRAHIRLRNRLAQEVTKGSADDVAKLNPHQRRVIFHAVQGLVTPDDAVRAVEQLRARRASIVAEREASGTAIPDRLKATHDELATIDYAIKHADQIFTPELRTFVAGEAERSKRLGDLDPSFRDSTGEARRLRPQGEVLGITHYYSALKGGIEHLRAEGQITPHEATDRLAKLEDMRPELDRAYAEKVRAAADAEGLPEPGFISHFKRDDPRHINYTAGQGKKAAAAPRTSGMELLRTGRADQRAQALFDSHAANVRRGINWQLVTDQFRAHALPISFAEVKRTVAREHATPDNLHPSELKDILDARGLDPRDYVFYQPGRLQAHRADNPDLAASGKLDIAEPFHGTAGYYVLPKPAWDAIAGHVTTPTRTGRYFDKGMGLQSAALLGLSPKWLGTQIGANTLLTAIGIKGNVADLVNAQRWHHTLTPEEQESIAVYLGSGVSDHAQSVHLGATVDDRGKLVTAWRAFSTLPAMRVVAKANPLNVLFKVDSAQNQFFKRTLLYSKVKRAAFAKMGEDMTALSSAQARVAGILSLGPEDLMREIVRDPAALEKQAEATLEVLGDYSRYTARERATLKRYVLFYGFLRYAVRTAFYTLPVHHPLATALTAQLGELHDREVEDLLGGPTKPWNYSKIYLGANGERSIDLASMSPVANPAFDLAQEGPKGAGGLMSPLLAAVMDQVYGESAFTGKPFTGHGNPEFGSGLDAHARLGIFASDMLRTTAPGRVAINLGNRGAITTDDSLPWSPQRVEYKTAPARLRARKRIANQGTVKDTVLGGLVPFYPKPDPSKAIAEDQKKRTHHKKRRKATQYFGTGSP